MMTLKGKNILVVEDDMLNRVVYQITLGVQGAFLDFDRWGRETLERLKKGKNWDIIILDLMLRNGMSGYDIFQKIRALPEYNDIPIVAVSASEPSVAMPRVRDLGFNGFISKPIDEGQFANQIARIIAGEQIWYDGTIMPH
ncbi:MAG: response regulator [Anaerolineaceae bacterium]|nr:response regulator [Anaerolineaceae bacterium]